MRLIDANRSLYEASLECGGLEAAFFLWNLERTRMKRKKAASGRRTPKVHRPSWRQMRLRHQCTAFGTEVVEDLLVVEALVDLFGDALAR